MTLDILREHFADYLRKSQIKIDITGFDMDAFSRTVDQDLVERLVMVERIAFDDEEFITNDQKIEVIQSLFRSNFLHQKE